MNKENLLRMADHIETVPQDVFSMRYYRGGGNDSTEDLTHECKSVGCVIGHCVILDNWENVPKDDLFGIYYMEWSEKFTGLRGLSYKWIYAFSGDWKQHDNTPKGAAERLRKLANGFEPTVEDLPWYN